MNAVATQTDWQEREWDVLAAMAEAKGLVLYRASCLHSEYFNAGQEPRIPGVCTRCLLRAIATQGEELR